MSTPEKEIESLKRMSRLAESEVTDDMTSLATYVRKMESDLAHRMEELANRLHAVEQKISTLERR